jgi:hypothetical protein
MKDRMMPLRKLKRWPTLKRFLQGHFVRIYSMEHGCYWRDNYAGYTYYKEAAGVYAFEDAFKNTHHCGPEKGIHFEVAQPEYCI